MEGRAHTALGQILRQEGRKQRWLAERVGVSEAQMSYIVSGYVPNEAVRLAIAEALGRDVAEVFPDSPQVAA